MPAPSPFNRPFAAPYYPEHGLFYFDGAAVRQQDFNGWKAESLSWKKTCYIHAGLSMPGQILYRGPDAEAFLSSIFINNFSNFRVGTAKHAIACDDNGLITGHGVLQRLAPDAFCVFVSGTWTLYRHATTTLDVEQVFLDRFLFQVAGPTALQTLEAAAGESLRDIGFLRFRDITIAGKTVQVLRVGMAGTLGYELHGAFAEGPEVYDAVFRAGQPFGIERLGWRTFQVNHVEGGFPQQFWTFTASVFEDEGYRAFARSNPYLPPEPQFIGSTDPQDRRARYRTPCEVGWERSAKLDHDFTGRAAIEHELADPKRTVVTLEWDPEDVIDIYASLFRLGEEYKYLEAPTVPGLRPPYAYADDVVQGGRRIGISSGVVYSYFYRQQISMCTIDRDQAEIGNEVVVRWGDHGGRIKDVRARVARFPYLNEVRNRDVSV
jgi:vanillate/3-O-methylgallate O-demethylase